MLRPLKTMCLMFMVILLAPNEVSTAHQKFEPLVGCHCKYDHFIFSESNGTLCIAHSQVAPATDLSLTIVVASWPKHFVDILL